MILLALMACACPALIIALRVYLEYRANQKFIESLPPTDTSPMPAMMGIAAQIEKEMFDPTPDYSGKGKNYGSYWYDAETDEIEWASLHTTHHYIGEIVHDQFVFLGNVQGDFDETV